MCLFATVCDIISRMDNPNAVLDRFLEPVRQSLTRDQARKLVEFRADEATQALIDKLAAKCNEGTLTEAERIEYEAFVEAGDIIAILQAQARDVLERAED